jgi:hypothetical protein
VASPIALLSIRGMTVLFPSSQVAIVSMTATMEAAKLVTVTWLARRWRSRAWIWRLALAGFVLGLAVINAGGTYSQLVAAHVGDRSERESYITMKNAELADRRGDCGGHQAAEDRRGDVNHGGAAPSPCGTHQ